MEQQIIQAVKAMREAQKEYCRTEDYPGSFIRPHAFIAGAKLVIKCLSTIPVDEMVDEVVELFEELKQEEELSKWTLKKMSPFVPNKCESCDRFDECYTKSGRCREFCRMYGANVVFKFKEYEKDKVQR